MFEFPDLKFEKSCDYLENQLQLHNNHKQQILGIINSANLDSKNSEDIKSSCYANFVNDANKILETISNNITSIESLNSELKNLNVELNSVIAIEPPKTRGKKLFQKTCTDLKDNLIKYSKNFEEIESKLNLDNIYFTEFINKNNYSYIKTLEKDTEKREKIEDIVEDIEYSINKDFIQKIQNTTSFELEDLTYNATEIHSVASPIFDLNDYYSNITEATINPELEHNLLLNSINTLNSGDILILSLDMPSADSNAVIKEKSHSTNNIIPENNNEIIECIEIEKGFAEKIKKIDKLIDNELLPEIKNIENIIETPTYNDSIDNQNQNTSRTKQKNLTKDNLSKESFNEKIERIKNANYDNKTLIISERLDKIYLPYKKSELLSYIESNPQKYESLEDVVKQEFTLPFQFFKNQSSKLRFSETFKLLKNRENLGFIKSISYSVKVSRKRNLNPVIIASCKSKFELESYIYYLDSNNLNNFRFFDIVYEVNPLKNKH